MPDELDALFEKNMASLVSSLDKSLQSVLNDCKRLQQDGQKGTLSHIYISFLISSVLCRLPWLRVDLYDENDRSDIVECYADWDAKEISDKLYRDAEDFAKQKGRMKEYELEQAWLDASETYYKAFDRHLPSIIDACSAASGINCEWHFGQLLGKAVTVRGKGNDEIL